MTTQITPPRVAFLDPRTGAVSREWYLFFLSLYDLTGGGTSTVSLEDIQLGPPDGSGLVSEALETLSNAVSQVPPGLPADALVDLQNRVQGLETAPPIAPAPTIIEQGTYTPTLTGVTNVSATSSAICIYSRLNDIVTVSGTVSVTATDRVSTVCGISLPIASNLAAKTDVGGCGASADVQQAGGIEADTANDRAEIRYIAVDTSARGMFFTFQYRII